MFETELLILQTWKLKDFFVLLVMVGAILFLLEYSLRSFKKSWKFFARPVALFLISWVLLSVASILGAPKPVGNFKGPQDLTTAPIIGISNPKSYAPRVGLRSGDRILMLHSNELNTLSDAQVAIDSIQKSQIRETDIEVQRGLEKARFRFHLIFTEDDPTAGIGSGELLVKEVFPSSPGELAGLQAGDFIKAIDGTPVRTMNEAKKLLAERQIDKTELLISREGQEVPIAVSGAEAGIGVRSEFLLNPIVRLLLRETNLFKAFGANFVEALRWSQWSLEKLALITEWPKLNISNLSRTWFSKNPHDWTTSQEDFAYYLTLVAIFCASSIPFIIAGSYFVAKSVRPKIAVGAQYVASAGLLIFLWMLVAASIDQYFIL